ncbi:MAG: hypothetical protein M1830_006340 [Pleopsidium flavum]|nr:MAG: hypothetical protein M1830_006340 [Pleopsidium flavum]
MDRLVEATIEHGLVPQVVMEFPGITVGGGFAGTSGKSSSFKYGFFDRIFNWIEMLIEAKNYVELTYHPITSVPEAIQKIEQATKDPSNDYVDGSSSHWTEAS